MIRNKKGQIEGGLITGLVFGVASLVIGVIIAYVIISTLTGAELMNEARITTTGANETFSGGLNNTGFTLRGATGNFVTGSFAVSAIKFTGNGSNINPAIYSVSNEGYIKNISILSVGVYNASVKVDYTYLNKSLQEASTDKLSTNFTAGINNVSSKLPTVLLVAAIVLILGVLAILVGVWQRMRMGGGANL